MKNIRKRLAVLLVLCFVVSLAPLALADDATGGTCGENATWTLEDGVLTISGMGAMQDYTSRDEIPWYPLRDTITSAVVADGITSIGEGAFAICSSLSSVTLPNSVTSIGYAAFSECSNLTSVTIPDSVTSIGDWAFESCTSLTSVTLPDSVTSIGGAAFTDCTGLTSITIPSGVTSIGSDENGAFDGCLNLTEILVSADNAAFTAEDGILFNKDKTVLVCYPAGKAGAYTIPGSVTSLYTDAFAWCSGLTSITIPDSVVTLGGWSFYFCDNLTSVTIPSSVTSIGDYTFDGCTSLTEILVDAGNPAFTAEDGILFKNDKTEMFCYPANKVCVS
ncbi:MAG: leucine-rich repeat domain-containing protein [Oscillospiraceae bacterium]|nr:leucine-rich repeat domain-containing protein [Oscillospiraceae bacterium]